MSDLPALNIPQEELGRQAVASLRGYAYQIWTSALAWSRLRRGEALLLEVADDYSLLSADALALRQIKDTAASGSVTLATKGVVDAINRLWRFRKANPDLAVTLAYLTTASIGHERDLSFPDKTAGLDYWRSAAREGVDTQPLRRAVASLNLDSDLRAWVAQASDEALRGELLRRVRFECAEPPLAEIETLLHESLSHLAATAGGRGLDVRALADSLVIDVLRAAVASNPEARRLDRQNLVARIVAMASSDLPSLGNPGAASVLDRLDVNPRGPLLAERPDASLALRQSLMAGEAWLYGPSGIGKTALARTLVSGENRPWYSVDLRDLTAKDAARRLRLVRQDLRSLDVFGGVVLDDLNVSVSGSVKRELSLLIHQVRLDDARLLITAYNPPAPSAASELAFATEAIVAAPRFSEAETAALVSLAGGGPDIWARAIHLFSGSGYPQLVAARVAGLRARTWPADELLRMLEGLDGDGVDAEKKDARQRLLDELRPGAASLLYRVSLITGAFDRRLALDLAAASPAIPEAGAALDLLTGPWLEPLSGERLRVSPLVADAGVKTLSKAEQLVVHSAVAESLSTGERLNTNDLPQLLLSSMRAGSRKGLEVVVHAALLGKVPDDIVARVLYPLAFMRTDRVLFASVPAVNVMLRVAQVKVAALNELANEAEQAFKRLEEEVMHVRGGKVLRDTAAFTLISNVRTFPSSTWFPIVDSLAPDAIGQANALFIKEGEGPVFGDSDRDFPVRDMGAFLFTVQSHHLSGLEDLSSLIDALGGLAGTRREAYLAGEGLERRSDNRQTLVQTAWMAETKRDGFTAAAAIDRLQALAGKVAVWADEVFEVELLCARIVMLSEYADQTEAALSEVDVAMSRRPDNARLRRERVKLLIRLKRFTEVANDAALLLKDAAAGDTVDRVFASRDVAIATAEKGDLRGAITQLQETSEIALAANTLTSLGLRLQADVVVLAWRAGDRADALNGAKAVLERSEKAIAGLDVSGATSLIRGLYLMAEVMFRDLTVPGGEAETPSVAGIASRPSENLPDLPTPVLLAIWYRLAEIERLVGVEVGLEAGLQVRRRTGRLVAFESVRSGWMGWGSVAVADPAEVAAAIPLRSRPTAWLRSQRGNSDERITADEMFVPQTSMPWDGPINLTDEADCGSALQTLVVSFAFAVSRGETDWLSRLSDTAGDPGLRDIIAGLPPRTAAVDASQANLAAFWALRLISSSDHTVAELFLATAYMSHWLVDLLTPEPVAAVVGPILAARWQTVALERSFGLVAPALAKPAILAAAADVMTRQDIARLLLAIRFYVPVTVAPEVISEWRFRADSAV